MLSGVELIIYEAVASDAGTYECKATNPFGTVTKQIEVDVLAGTPGSGEEGKH